MKSVLILQNEVMAYRKPVYNRLADDYELVVLHSGRPSVEVGDRYREVIIPRRQVWRFQFQPSIQLGRMIGRFDAVIAMFDIAWPAYLAPLFWRNRPKFILWGHRYGTNRIACAVRNQLMQRADRLLMYGDEEVDRMVANGVDPAKIVIAWNTIQVPNHRDHSEAQKGSLLYVGRLQERKRVDLVIQTFSMLQGRLDDEVTLDIVGGGEVGKELKRLAGKLDISHKVNFHGRIDEPERLAKIFSRAYAYVSPGPVGLGVLHSLAYGVPVITLRDVRHGPEYHNLAHDENALICEDESVIEDAMLNICTNKALAKRLGNNAYQYYVRERPLSRMLEGFRKAIED